MYYNNCLIFFIFALAFLKISAITIRCSSLTIPNGSVQFRGRLVRFQCKTGYELIGRRTGLCSTLRGWRRPVPRCVRKGCTAPSIRNGMFEITRNGAVAMFFCDPGYDLEGDDMLYCNGKEWEGNQPICKRNAKTLPPLSCDFEIDLCEWTAHVLSDEFYWNRVRPSVRALIGPDMDHTKQTSHKGYYVELYDVTMSQNQTALLYSPVFPSNLTEDGCFQFYYYITDILNSTSLRVYVHPESVNFDSVIQGSSSDYLMLEIGLEKSQGSWTMAVIDLQPMEENFQIIIEGVADKTLGHLAIDDISIKQKEECVKSKSLANQPHHSISPVSCQFRCGYDPFPQGLTPCQCNDTCIMDNICCPDYNEYCASDTYDSTTTDSSNFFYSSSEYEISTSSESPLDHSEPRLTFKFSKHVPPTKYTWKPYYFTAESKGRTTILYPDMESEKTTETSSVTTTITSSTTVKTTTKPTTIKTTLKTTLLTTLKPTKSTKLTTTEKQTLLFKTPPKPLFNLTGLLNKTVSIKAMNTTTTDYKRTTIAKNDDSIRVIPLTTKKNQQNKSPIKITTTSRPQTKTIKTMSTKKIQLLLKSTTKIQSLTTPKKTVKPTARFIPNVSKTYEHYGKDNNGKTKIGNTNSTGNETNVKEVNLQLGSNKNDVNQKESQSDLKDSEDSGLSTASRILITLLCMTVIICLVVVILSRTGYHRRFASLARSRVRRTDYRRPGSSADMRFLVEDEELEHDL